MSQADVNPEELRRFAAALRTFQQELQESRSRVQAQFNELGETWRDQEHARFAAVFEETVQALDRFTVACDEHVPFLQRKANAADTYLNQR